MKVVLLLEEIKIHTKFCSKNFIQDLVVDGMIKPIMRHGTKLRITKITLQ